MSFLLRLLTLWLFVAVVAPTPLDATSLRGLPLLQRYTTTEIPAAPGHQSVVSDARGVIYVANSEGVLRFGGGEWELFELPGKSGARSLLRAWDGRIYLGGYDLFGVLEDRPDGSLQFEDLRPRFKLEGNDLHVGPVWSVLETARGLYFRADRSLFFLGRDGVTRQWPLAPEVRLFFVVDEALYARVEGVGFTRFENGRLVPMPGADIFAGRGLLAVVGRGDHLLLASSDGFYRSDAQGIRKIASAADAVFADNEPYSHLQLDDGSLVFGSYDGMLTRFSAELELLDRVRLGAHTLSSFGTDREGGLWVATEVELLRLRLPSPWTVYGEAQGLVGTLNDSVWYDDSLWVATSVELLRSTQRDDGQVRFEPQGWAELESYDLEATAAGLLLGERNGLQVLDPGASAPRRLSDDSSVVQVKVSDFDPQRAWALGDSAVVWLGQRDGRWQVVTRWPTDNMSINAVYETARGELWLGDLRGIAQRWRFDSDSGELREQVKFGPEQGLRANPEFGTTLLRLEGVLYAVSEREAFRFDGERFVPGDLGIFSGIERLMELDAVETPLGSYAWTSRQLWHKRGADTPWQALHLDAAAAGGYSQPQVHADGKLRLITWSGLLQFDPGVADPPPPPLQTRLERVELRAPEQAPALIPLQPASPPQLPPQSGLGLRFGLVSMEPGSEFRYRLVGYSDAWGAWNGERDLNYRSLPPGEFRLDVEARTRSGRAAEPLSYAFSVRPLWYQTPWAWALGVFGALLLVAGIAQAIVAMRYRQYVTNTRRLERKISERTAELETANRKLSELATEDSLTGVANRRALEQALAREWQRCGELRLPLAVVMVDVDHFKQFNDKHGHLEGDQQLKRVAQLLSLEVQPVRELLARFGGEEFALILPGLHLEEAMARAERLRQRFQPPASNTTISLGVASVVPSPALEPPELLRRADTALYRAKRKGRNRVEAAED